MDCTEEWVKLKISTLKILAGVMEEKLNKPVLKIGRICG